MVNWAQIVWEASKVFTPGAPVSRRDCFAGRKEQLARILPEIVTPGRHPIIYGQRGVGKTSLANIVAGIEGHVLAAKVVCDGGDTFGAIWNRLLRDCPYSFKEKAWGFSREEIETKVTLAAFLGREVEEPRPSDVVDILRKVQEYTVFVIDEFDKTGSQQVKASFADLIKIVSDTVPRVTIIIVGVAESISSLIGEHQSVERNLVQVELPTMSNEEIASIVRAGWDSLGFSFDDKMPDRVAQLSNGFPHYAHLLGLWCVRVCAVNETDEITPGVFQVACDKAIGDAIETYRSAYAQATRTAKASRYPAILCACAYAKHDEQGVFRATDVAQAMSTVFKTALSVPAVVPALGAFCTEERGKILTAVKTMNRNQYRLSDPMFRPFLRMKSLQLLQDQMAS